MTTLALLPQLPLTLTERSLAPEVIRAAATFEEYLAFAEQCEYNVEYINGEIISMSQASLPHELLVGRIIYTLINLFDNDDQLTVFSSNIKLFIEATGDSVNADVTMVQGAPDYLRLPSGNLSTATVKNPVLIVEVLSGSTMAFDLGDKLDIYKQIPSLQQVLFVSQHKPWVSSYARTPNPTEWLNTSVHALTESITVLDNTVALADLYKKFTF
ncbi:Uma2 family endonuclease [Fibrella aquatilis]|uniref:Uma2 family endonuclease n=1 Tax=Fibrella aquatilis TaxID=2817059 RepID=A0A939G9V5_9BACT|nr:Uma2 family endonuclease [Fibrella aquatilis]MBO0933665.1 Uma2 family endonuclease [Fibrella aquatilis]